MELKDIVALIGLCGAVIGLFLTATQMLRTYRVQRGSFFKELYEPFFLDEQILDVFRLIEEGAPVFHKDFGASSGDEQLKRQKAVERLLAQFEIICSLFHRRLLSRDDMVHFEYNIQRVCLTPGFDDYVRMLEEWQKARGLPQGPYSSFLRYVRENRSRLGERAMNTHSRPNTALHRTRGKHAARR